MCSIGGQGFRGHHDYFSYTDLSRANLRGAYLNVAHVRDANLSGASLGANLSRANLSDANLSGAICRLTVFANLDLSEATGLETVQHYGLSTIGTDTLFLSEGKIPDAFLRGCGLPDELISYLSSLIQTN